MSAVRFRLAALAAVLVHAGSAGAVDAADYARAERVLDSSLAGALRNAYVDAHWLDGRRFWYRRSGADGAEYVLVDAARGTRAPLFDRARLAAALGAADAAAIEVSAVESGDGVLQAEIRRSGGGTMRCRLDRYACAPAAPPAAADALPAPDGRREAFARDGDLWLRERGGAERRLTSDGAPHFAYGKLPDTSLASVPALRSKAALPPVGMLWSPDGRRLLGTRVDERAVAPYPFVEWVPQDGSFRPIAYSLRIPLLGDAAQPVPEAFVIDVTDGTKHVIDAGDGTFADGVLAWSADGRKAYRLLQGERGRRLSLAEIDLADGRLRRVVDETATTAMRPNNLLYSPANARVLTATGEAIWFSERSGWGHLYLYDLASGRLKRALTRGDWLVRDVVHVDARQRTVWFTASGREKGRDPYYRHLYRVSLDGGEPVLLTPEDAEHEVESPLPGILPSPRTGTAFSPDGRYFVDTYSTVAAPPVTLLRDGRDGRVVMKLEDADAAAVRAAGWRPPERVSAKSADGRTDLYAVVYRPPGFRRDRAYPVIDAFYGGPQMLNAPRSYAEAVATFNPVSRASLAELGFVVVTIDARGTRGRSRAFADVGYGNFADPQIDDHIAVIRQLAARYGGFDLDRVGVYGHSFGGYTSARAILSHPEFYKVAVSSAGPHNYQGFYDGLEGLLGEPDYGDGRRVRPTPQSVPANFKAMDNATLAPNLRGRLMLVYGDMDENALPAVTLQLADALIKANKRFDLVYLPNRTHGYFRTDRYYTRLLWDHFVEHLLGERPPQDVDLGRKAGP